MDRKLNVTSYWAGTLASLGVLLGMWALFPHLYPSRPSLWDAAYLIPVAICWWLSSSLRFEIGYRSRFVAGLLQSLTFVFLLWPRNAGNIDPLATSIRIVSVVIGYALLFALLTQAVHSKHEFRPGGNRN